MSYLRFNFFFYLCVCFLFCSHAADIDYPSHQVLCVDIGGTRVKAAVLHPGISLEELKKVSTVAFDSKDWMNANLPQLFSNRVEGSLRNRIDTTYQVISFGITGPVKDGRLHFLQQKFKDGSLYPVSEKPIPRELKERCEEAADCPVFVECDTAVWCRGALYWQSLIGQDVQFPCLGITFGTGVGVALLNSPNDIINIEISVLDSAFQRLFKTSQEQPKRYEYGRPSPHDPLGAPFFLWINKDPCNTEDKVQQEFNLRATAFLKDMLEYIETKLEIDVNSLMIGGGNSRYIPSKKLQKELGKPIILLSPQNIQKFQVSPDVISLLGCLMTPHDPSVKMLPPWEELLPWYNMKNKYQQLTDDL